ncbi:MAG: RHS repeat-associated core domain-containing protein [Candidatus Saccharimonadales bacterium]
MTGSEGWWRRRPPSTAPTTTFTVWCGHQLCQSQNPDHTIARQYYAEGEYIPSEQASLYYGPDPLGSVRDAYATSPVFNIPQAYDYDPTGNPLVVPTNGPLTDFRYAHMFYHPDSGLYLTERRAYDPRTGRWLSRDPLGEGSDPAANLYRYVQGNPISLTDPSGLWTVEFGITVYFGAFQFGAGIAVDGYGNVGTYRTEPRGGAGTGGLSGGATFGASDAPTICGLGGGFTNYSGGAGAGPDAGAGAFFGTTPEGTPVIGGEVNYGIGFGGGASVGFTDTTVTVIGQL